MKFRIRDKKGDLLDPQWHLLGGNGKVYRDNTWNFERVDGVGVELLVGKDSEGNDFYENDILMGEYSSYRVGFDMEMGAYLECKNGSKIPLKQCVEKLVLIKTR